MSTEGWGSYSSRSVVMGGNAIVMAANELTARIARCCCGAARLRRRRRSCSMPAARARRTARSLPLRGVRRHPVDSAYASNKRTYSYGAHAAHVAVDAKTGQVEVIDYVAVEDVGRIINPLTLHGQAVGAVVQGLGGVLSGALRLRRRWATADGIVRRLPPAHRQRLSAHPRGGAGGQPSPNNPLGAKGAGEGGIIPVGGVIANAVAAALAAFGAQPNALPLSPPRVWGMINAAPPAA